MIDSYKLDSWLRWAESVIPKALVFRLSLLTNMTTALGGEEVHAFILCKARDGQCGLMRVFRDGVNGGKEKILITTGDSFDEICKVIRSQNDQLLLPWVETPYNLCFIYNSGLDLEMHVNQVPTSYPLALGHICRLLGIVDGMIGQSKDAKTISVMNCFHDRLRRLIDDSYRELLRPYNMIAHEYR